MVTDSVSHADFLAAVKPLLDLCGTTAEDTFSDIRITQKTEDKLALLRIEMVVANDPFDGTEPVVVGDDPETAAQGWPLVVEVH